MSGAIQVCYPGDIYTINNNNKIENKLGIECIPEWNDNATFDMVIAVVKELDI